MLAGRIIIPTTPGIKTPTKIPELEMKFFFQSGETFGVLGWKSRQDIDFDHRPLIVYNDVSLNDWTAEWTL